MESKLKTVNKLPIKENIFIGNILIKENWKNLLVYYKIFQVLCPKQQHSFIQVILSSPHV